MLQHIKKELAGQKGTVPDREQKRMAVSNIFIAKAYLVSSCIKCFPMQIKNGERTVNIVFAHSHPCTRSNFHNVLHPEILEALALLLNCNKLPHNFFLHMLSKNAVEKCDSELAAAWAQLSVAARKTSVAR